jgi:divalent metal cation (Fe/Co/Zn/Cd) transporter
VGAWKGREEEAAEQRAERLIGVTFLMLAAYIALHSGTTLAGWLPKPEPSPVGVAIVVASALVMSGLYISKMPVAVRMQSRSLRAEAVESLVCDLQDLTVLVGLVFNALFSWWWADPASALALIPFLVKEGRENLSGHDDENEGGPRRVCFCRGCLFGLRTCRLACCTAA